MEQTQEQEQRLTEMKKSLQTLGSSTENYGDPMLMRFLVARSMDPVKAAKMLVQWQKWRQEFVPLGYIPDSEVPEQLEARKVYLQGLSKSGLPLVIARMKLHFIPKNQLQFKKFVVHFLDKVIASSFKEGKEIGNEKMIGVIDLDDISFRNVDARGLITGFQFLQAYYPERLEKLFILSMPRFFLRVWKMVSRFLEKATLDKVIIVGNEDERRNFMEEIGEEILPEEYGGRAKLIALQDVKLDNWLVTQ